MPTFIRTVLGDIAPEFLGATYMHEHLIIDSPIVAKDFEHIHLPSVDEAIAELRLCKKVGVDALVDCMPTGSGRDIRKLADISMATGLHVIAITGLHHARYYEKSDPLENATVEELAEIFIKEISIGAEGSEYRVGVIKVVTSGPSYSDRERSLFEAAAIANAETGAPILTHCEHGTGALEQIKLLQLLNVPLTSVILSHTDKEPDLGYHREILSSGVFVEYDQCLRQSGDSEPTSAKLTAAMVNAGYLDQIMLGTDGARRTLWRTLGGSPGLSWLFSGWSKKLIETGLSEEDVHKIFVINPARALSFRERS